MSSIFTAGYRRRGGGVAPTATVASASTVPLAGGTVYVTGAGFTVAAIVNSDGVARATTFVSATRLTAVVPARAVGTVSLVVVDGATSNSVTMEYWDAYTLAYTFSGDARTALAASLYWPDTVAGFAGNAFYANAVAWTTVLLGGKTHRLPADTMTYGQGYKASGGAFQVYADILGDATSWTMTFEGAFPQGVAAGVATTGFGENTLFYQSPSAGSGCQVWTSKASGGNEIRVRVGSTVIFLPFNPATKCVVQVRYVYNAGTPANSTVSMRINLGAWSTPVVCGLASVGGSIASYPTILTNPDQVLAGWDDTNNGVCGVGWCGFMQSAMTDANADRLTYWTASEFGVAL